MAESEGDLGQETSLFCATSQRYFFIRLRMHDVGIFGKLFILQVHCSYRCSGHSGWGRALDRLAWGFTWRWPTCRIVGHLHCYQFSPLRRVMRSRTNPWEVLPKTEEW